MRTSSRSGMFVAVNPPEPCGRIIGTDPNGPDAFGLLGLTDATSKLVGAAGCAGACAQRLTADARDQDAEARSASDAVHTTPLLSSRREGSTAEVSAESVPFIESLLSTVPTYFNSTCNPARLRRR